MITIRNLVKPSHKNYKNIKRACLNASAIFNCANYIMRQSFFDGDVRKWNSVDKQLKNLNPIYQTNPSAASQTTIKRLGEDWNSFWKGFKDYKKSPNKYKKRPKPPAYSKKLKTYIQPFQSLKAINGYVHFPKKLELEPMKFFNIEDQETLAKGNAKEIRFVPHGHCFWVEVIYDDVKKVENNQKDIKLNKENHIAIDLGIDNLLTIISNVDTVKPILIKGKIIKSINIIFIIYINQWIF